MPAGRNHAASATDGTKFYIFGGRTGGNTVSNGFNDVQIYDPATNTWAWSGSAGSTIAPLPQARGGTGKAVFYNGEFYVMGGETSTGAGATSKNVYNRVDIYNPTTNSWRLGTPMPTARHGIFPLLSGNKIYVAGGGIQSGNSQSNILEILTLS
jgi:N-acetylneuraminic acid mutarotase